MNFKYDRLYGGPPGSPNNIIVTLCAALALIVFQRTKKH